ncbi:glycoside hydrolase family 13 protein [Pedobacter boryungensis]|uniref:Glycoside hydrolase family 13 protein n=1 Tax=Pedobacter boryungensis TaxID=869962 RepID=A0ABX2D9H5_9SPHI|nr:glycoside hydrolase family 13 protein [Pedobacter boryungensis]NQX30219.1 glycoside hydrolase family 13 protein [Pedobacter boryungensis]
MIKKLFLLTVFLSTQFQVLKAQMANLERIEPLNWWVGFKDQSLQLLVRGNRIADKTVSLNYPGVKLVSVQKVENPNYLFVNLQISSATKSGTFPIIFTKKGEKEIKYTYELKSRTNHTQGVTNKDFIYLIMPDRFSNGDQSNDKLNGMKDMTLNRDSMYYRHGGDIQGIINNLPYLQELGVTTLWLNPVLENDEYKTSYHGYANTENYQIDRRFGNNALYKKLVDECHKRGMKMIKDLVHNHIGDQHFLFLDPPAKDWFHQWPKYTGTTYKDQVLFDPYAAKADKKLMTDGWFDNHMPDVNQQNPLVKKYITQSHIWWIEYAGLDGFRLDTYAYNDRDFMAEWAKAITREFPKFTYFGETWVNGTANQVFFTEGNTVNQHFNTGLQGVTDFQTYFAINETLNGKFGWTDGVNRLYTVLASDYQYKDPTRNVLFLDNHDISRFYSVVGEDFNKYKSGIILLLSLRGIPQMYYGTEILMKNFANPDGKVRDDFPGGWSNDKANKFIASGRNEKENEAFNFVKKLANYRKNNSVLQTGKLMQYVPENGIYVYFRYTNEKTVMVVMNTNEQPQELTTSRFSERIGKHQILLNIITDQKIPIDKIKLPANTSYIFELQ